MSNLKNKINNGWINDRPPTKEDADFTGRVLWGFWIDDMWVVWHESWKSGFSSFLNQYSWQRTNMLPPDAPNGIKYGQHKDGRMFI